MTKEEAYEKATMIELGNNPNGTRQDVIYKAMDIWEGYKNEVLNQVLDSKENQRRSWADMCIKKQEQVEFLESEVQRLLQDNMRLTEVDSFKKGTGDIA